MRCDSRLTVGSQVHPWFGGVPIDQAAGWTWDFFTQNDVDVADAVSNKPTPYIAEVRPPGFHNHPSEKNADDAGST